MFEKPAFTKKELEAAYKSLASTLQKCEKVQDSTRLGPSQRTLLSRRIAALKLALDLIVQETGRLEAEPENPSETISAP